MRVTYSIASGNGISWLFYYIFLILHKENFRIFKK